MTKIQLRRGIESEWASANPILSAGEVGVELDTNKFKIGNGSDAFADLTYFSAGAGASDPSTWLVVSNISELPGGGNALGQRALIVGAVGVEVRMWLNVSWVIAPEAYTDWWPVPILNAAQFGDPELWVKREYNTVNLRWVENDTTATAEGSFIGVWSIEAGWQIDAPHIYAGCWCQALDTALGEVQQATLAALPYNQGILWYSLIPGISKAASLSWQASNIDWPVNAPAGGYHT